VVVTLTGVNASASKQVAGAGRFFSGS